MKFLVFSLLSLFLLPTAPQELKASTTPIPNNPIPSWSSVDDICTKKKSCDFCVSPQQYCRFKSDGTPLCCARPTTNVVPTDEMRPDIIENNDENDTKINIGPNLESISKLADNDEDPNLADQIKTLKDKKTKKSELSTGQIKKIESKTKMKLEIESKSDNKTDTTSASQPENSTEITGKSPHSDDIICYDITPSTDCDSTETKRTLPLKTGVQNQCCLKPLKAPTAPILRPEWADEAVCVKLTDSCDSCQRNKNQFCKVKEKECCKRVTMKVSKNEQEIETEITPGSKQNEEENVESRKNKNTAEDSNKEEKFVSKSIKDIKSDNEDSNKEKNGDSGDTGSEENSDTEKKE